MCIAAPVRVLDISEGALPMGHISHGGEAISCCFAYVPEARVGDYVLIQHGFAIEVLDPVAAEESFAAFAELTSQVFGDEATSVMS